MGDFTGKHVVVVSISNSRQPPGSRAHLGAACAEDFAADGAHVVAVDSDQRSLDALAERVRANNGRITTILTDLMSPTELRDACASLDGAIDVLVTCHHDTEAGSIEAVEFEAFERVVRFNLLGPLYASKAFLPGLKRSAAGAVVHIGSIDGTLGNPQVAAYSISKGGLTPLTHVMAQEFGRFGIRVNCVARAIVVHEDTPLTAAQEPIVALTPLARAGAPDDVSALVRFLASPAAAYISGAIIPIDGGRSGVTPGTYPT